MICSNKRTAGAQIVSLAVLKALLIYQLQDSHIFGLALLHFCHQIILLKLLSPLPKNSSSGTLLHFNTSSLTLDVISFPVGGTLSPHTRTHTHTTVSVFGNQQSSGLRGTTLKRTVRFQSFLGNLALPFLFGRQRWWTEGVNYNW